MPDTPAEPTPLGANTPAPPGDGPRPIVAPGTRAPETPHPAAPASTPPADAPKPQLPIERRPER